MAAAAEVVDTAPAPEQTEEAVIAAFSVGSSISLMVALW